MKYLFSVVFIASLTVACKKNNPVKLIDNRNFKMGFTSWSYGPNLEDVNGTYDQIFSHGDVYAEHMDDKIPWESWINGTELPAEFVNNVAGKVARKPANIELLLSISFLNNSRDGIKEDFDGSVPAYSTLNDEQIQTAYINHVSYLIDAFEPDYLVMAIESNDFLINQPTLWDEYRSLMQNVRAALKSSYPTLQISESVTLHNWYEPDVDQPETVINKTKSLVEEQDFAAISFYPFFKGLNKRKEFQKAFDFLHGQTTKPIAFVETSHLANDLDIDAFDLHIKSSEKEQEEYLSSLLVNAHNHNYKFIIWWAYRDFDALWETFPAELKDLGKIWRDTGLQDENGDSRKGWELWNEVFAK